MLEQIEYALDQARPQIKILESGEFADGSSDPDVAYTYNNILEELSKLNLISSEAFERLYIK